MKKNLAWHFVGDTLRDGRPVPPDGVWLEHTGDLILCEEGLHWSRKPHQALKYAPGPHLCLVEVGGKIVEPKDEDKGISSRRKIIVRMDATELLRYFARQQALSVLHLWQYEPDQVVLDYLMGDDAADSAAWSAARSAAAAADSAAWSAALSAAWSAALSAAWSAADAADSAAWSAADAARIAADAARSAARSAASSAANDYFDSLVYESFGDWL